MTTIAIQGDNASFHDIAAKQYFNEQDTSRVYCDTFRAVFDAVDSGQADVGMCAIENSLAGSINEVYDLLLVRGLVIVGEVYLRIEQCLIGVPGSSVSDIQSVYSHPVALAQCEVYLDETLPQAKRLEYHDTAAAVELVKQTNDPTIAAIASRESADVYDMQVLAESIETNKENYTRFVVVAKQPTSEENTKTSLVIRTNHTPGALYNALGAFANRSINLSKIQSRPIVGKAWYYLFYIDVDAGDQQQALQDALSELRSQECEVTVLGSYIGASKE